MFRKVIGLTLVLCLTGLVTAQDKGKDKAKDKPAKTKAEYVKLDAKAMTLSVKIDGKAQDIKLTKDVMVYGPKGGKASIKDKRFGMKELKEVGLVFDKDGKTLREIHLPTIRGPKDKAPKDKPAKDKPKDKKEK